MWHNYGCSQGGYELSDFFDWAGPITGAGFVIRPRCDSWPQNGPLKDKLVSLVRLADSFDYQKFIFGGIRHFMMAYGPHFELGQDVDGFTEVRWGH